MSTPPPPDWRKTSPGALYLGFPSYAVVSPADGECRPDCKPEGGCHWFCQKARP